MRMSVGEDAWGERPRDAMTGKFLAGNETSDNMNGGVELTWKWWAIQDSNL